MKYLLFYRHACDEATLANFAASFTKYSDGSEKELKYLDGVVNIVNKFRLTGILDVSMQVVEYLQRQGLVIVLSVSDTSTNRLFCLSHATEDMLKKYKANYLSLMSSDNESHYIASSSEIKEIYLALFCHLKGDRSKFRKVTDAVYKEYKKYSKFGCGYAGELDKFALTLLSLS